MNVDVAEQEGFAVVFKGTGLIFIARSIVGECVVAKTVFRLK